MENPRHDRAVSWPAVGWHQGCVVLLDQRQLPHQVCHVTCASAVETAEAIRSMVVRGAPAIGCAAAFGLAAEAWRIAALTPHPSSWSEALHPGYHALRNARPTAVNLAWAVDRMWSVVTGPASAAMPDRLLAEARAILDEDLAACHTMGQLGATCIRTLMQQAPARTPAAGILPGPPADLTLMTHCNAGALATAGYGTALGVVRALHASGLRVRVVANETRPLLQGARLTAWELQQDGIPVTLITDSMAGSLMRAGVIDAVVVGADRVAANGDVANKIGTYTHAVVAHHHRIPFLVAAPRSTFDVTLASGADIPVEQRAEEEVTHWHGQRVAAAGIAVLNPAFDITPAALVTALVTETGVIMAPDRQQLAAWFK
jgi:methylthioribose-1-phosphate isomerase